MLSHIVSVPHGTTERRESIMKRGHETVTRCSHAAHGQSVYVDHREAEVHRRVLPTGNTAQAWREQDLRVHPAKIGLVSAYCHSRMADTRLA
jgi:hypothetical protein